MHWWLQEVDRLAPLGAPDAPFGALADFTYLEAVVSEALRLYPPVPMLMREAAQDWDLAGEPGWRIPAHSFVVVPVFAIGRDPAVWGPDVAEFRPERWLGHGKGGVNKHAVLGFGAGGRACIGKRFALEEAKLALIHLFQRLTFGPHATTPVPLPLQAGVTLAPKQPFVLVASVREGRGLR